MSKSVARNATAKMMLSALNIVLPMITGPYLARVLSVELYAEYNRAISMLGWFLPFAAFGVYNYGIREIAKAKRNRARMERMFTTLFAVSIVSSVSTFLLYLVYVALFPAQKALYLILGLQLLFQIIYVEWMNEAFENYGFILIKTFAVRSLNVLGTFLFVKKAEDVVPYAIIYTAVTFLNYFASFCYIKKHVKFCRIQLRDMTRSIKPLLVMLLMANANMLYTLLDKLFLSIFSDPVMVSYYVIPQSICGMIAQVVLSVILVTVPRLSEYIGNSDGKSYMKLLKKSSGLFFMLGIPMLVGISCLGEPIMLLYGGEAYRAAGGVLSLFALRTILWLCDMSLANQVLFIHGKERYLTRIYFLCGGLNLLLNTGLLLLGRLIPESLVVTTMIAGVVLVCLETKCIHSQISRNIRVINRTFWKYLIFSLPFYLFAYAGERFLQLGAAITLSFFLKIFVIIFFSVLFYAVCLVVSKDKNSMAIINVVISRIKRGW